MVSISLLKASLAPLPEHKMSFGDLVLTIDSWPLF